MRLNDATTVRLWNIAEPVCIGAGYELVDLTLTQSPGGWVLRVYIDHLPESGSEVSGNAPGNEAPGDDDEQRTESVQDDGSWDSARIGFDDCERVSRELGAVLDVEDPIEHAYSLEVSSPGLDRPLRTVDHFERFLGQDARVTLQTGIGGRRNFKGTLVSVTRDEDAAAAPDPMISEKADRVMITINVDGTEYRLPFNDIESARLVPDWDALFPRGQQR